MSEVTLYDNKSVSHLYIFEWAPESGSCHPAALDRSHSNTVSAWVHTRVLPLQENAPPKDTTVGLRLGELGGS